MSFRIRKQDLILILQRPVDARAIFIQASRLFTG
jgi:hypothetical protein